jgi:SRSO17 transposase
MLGDRAWQGKLLAELCALIVPVFAQARSRLVAFAYVEALLTVAGDRKSCWQLGEQAGHATPRRMQALLAEYAWDWRAVLERLQRFILAHLADPDAILVLDETAELKKGTMTVGVARQHAGITGQTGNCQTVVFQAYETARAHTLSNFRLYLPKQWSGDTARRERAQVPQDAGFATKTEQGTEMVTEAVTREVQFSWLAGDEVYGRSSKLRDACEDAGKGYVLAVPVSFMVTTTPGRRKTTVAALARLAPRAAWETRSCGRGCKGHRDYEWALAATSSPRHWVLIRRKISGPAELPGSPGALLHRGPLRTAHARSRARGPSKPLGRFRCLAEQYGACVPFRRTAAVAGRWHVRGVSGCRVRRCLAGGRGPGSPP